MLLSPQLVWCGVCIHGCIVVVALFIKLGESLFRENEDDVDFESDGRVIEANANDDEEGDPMEP